LQSILWAWAHSANAQETYRATHYGESYNGRPLGCGGTYSSWDTSIVAVGPGDYARWPCGTVLEVVGPQGTIEVIRQDSCPGCYGMIDLSEAGHAAVCGIGTCTVEVRSR